MKLYTATRLLTLVVLIAARASERSALGQISPVAGASTLSGCVRDTEGKPLQGAAVSLEAKPEAVSLSAQTDARGEYSFVVPRPGVYSLRVKLMGYSDSALSIFLEPGKTKTVDLTLEPGSAAVQTGPDFFDKPSFTVSGVTDTTSLGGHGSGTIVRSRQDLAKETASLGETPDGTRQSSGSPTDEAMRKKLEQDLSRPNLAPYDKAQLHHQLAAIEEKSGHPLEAIRDFECAAELEPTEPNLFDWGAELLLHHAPEPALEVFNRGNHQFPKSARMLIGAGAALFAAGSYDDAVQRICEASDLDPNNPTPYLFLARMQAAEKIPSDAVVERLHRFVRIDPDNAEANFYYASALWKRRKQPSDPETTAQIESLLNDAVQLNPKFAAAFVQLGMIHSEQQNPERAIADYQHAAQADPAMEEPHYRLAQAYREIGEKDKARAELALYDQAVKESDRKAERERHEIPQFVYTLRDQPAAKAP